MPLRLVFTLLLVFVAPRIAAACMCGGMPPCQRFWLADAVFTGVVTGITRSDENKRSLSHTTFVVERGFRNASGQIVITGDQGSSCHFRFTVGQRYLVYAHRGADGALTTSDCSGNKLLADAEADLDFAERPPPPGSGGRIYGTVKRIEQDLLDQRNSRDRFPANMAITLRHADGGVVDLWTDAQGRYEATGLKPGNYSISVGAPETARVDIFPTTIDLKDRSCVPVYISLSPNGRIAGRIVDSSGRPAKVWVSVFPKEFTNKAEYPRVSIATKITEADGRYEIERLPPGEYQVGVNVELAPRLESPYQPTYYPGVLTRSEAQTITLGDGEMRRANFTLPRKLDEVAVSGTVIFPDGTPAPGVDVFLVAGTVLAISSSRTSASGTFTLKGLAGSTYLLRASFFASAQNRGSASETISLTDESITGIKLTLQKP